MPNVSDPWPADKVERRPVKTLVPYARNARTHSDEQIAQIMASIREWGWTIPILVDEDSNIIAGHGRVLAAHRLGIEDVPVMVATGWSRAQRQAYCVADNRLAMNAGWDDEMLRIEILDLQDQGFDVALAGVGDDLLSGLFGANVDEVDPPDIPSTDKPPFQLMTFTLHNDQVETVKAAIDCAIDVGHFHDTNNENRNGNALERICADFLSRHP